MTDRQTIPHDAVLWIPRSVAVCPICGGRLWCQFEGWDERDDGSWAAGWIVISCEHEPDIDNDEWEEWHIEHYSQPYIDWLPVETNVKEWINARFNFDMDAKAKSYEPMEVGNERS